MWTQHQSIIATTILASISFLCNGIIYTQEAYQENQRPTTIYYYYTIVIYNYIIYVPYNIFIRCSVYYNSIICNII